MVHVAIDTAHGDLHDIYEYLDGRRLPVLHQTMSLTV